MQPTVYAGLLVDWGGVMTTNLFDSFRAFCRLTGAIFHQEYRGRLDDSGRSPKPNAPRELFDAMVQVARTGQGPREQTASIGCSIKWR